MNAKEIEFLEWLSKRLIFKHKYADNDETILKIKSIINNDNEKYKNILDINSNDLDLILSKYYVDWFLDKSEDLNIGYSHEDRLKIKEHIIDIVKDIISNNIPKESIIKEK